MGANRTARYWLAAIVILYLLLAALFALKTPAWQAPDEPAHYNYVRYVAEHLALPVLHEGDYPHAYLEQIKAAGFPADMPIDTIRYEFHQPPLYYALAAPIYTLAGGSLTALRLLSVLLGAGIVLLAYAIGRRVFPARPALSLGAAAVVAFLPQHLATVSQVGNDVLAELLFAAALYVMIGWIAAVSAPGDNQARGASPWLLGLLLGLILVTKTTAYIALPLAAGVLIWRWRREAASGRRIAHEIIAVLLPMILIALPLYARNIWAYGWPDFLGLQRHDAIVIGQTRTPEFIGQRGWGAYWRRAVEWTFKSFWGVFGWMGVWLDSRFYFVTLLLSGIALASCGLRLVFAARDRRAAAGQPGNNAAAEGEPRRAARRVAGLLAVSVLFTFLAYAWYNLTFLQHQGRYLFTALIPFALAYAWGWAGVLLPRIGRVLAVLLVVFGLGLAAWGILGDAGLPKWPLLLTMVAAGGVFVLSLLGPRLRNLSYIVPFGILPVLSLYALFLGIVPQLGGR